MADQILIHSLEGCVWHGFLGRLRSFDWTAAAGPPPGARAARGLRRSLRAVLRASAHPRVTLGGTLAAGSLVVLLSRRHPQRTS